LASLTKAAARERGRAARAALPAVEREANDVAISQLCQSEFEWQWMRRVHLFLPLRRKHEIETWGLIEWIWDKQPRVQVYVPLLVGREMEQVRVTRGAAWSLNRFGIPEPREGELLTSDEPLDLILAPLLAVDIHGCRVGYGGGYYDKFMATRPEARKVGLAYESWLTHDDIETSAQDVRLDGVVTEKRALWFANE
jgi:5-formyltetrahydrofolate cyclo-ligase